jgi:hypothetical protein
MKIVAYGIGCLTAILLSVSAQAQDARGGPPPQGPNMGGGNRPEASAPRRGQPPTRQSGDPAANLSDLIGYMGDVGMERMVPDEAIVTGFGNDALWEDHKAKPSHPKRVGAALERGA